LWSRGYFVVTVGNVNNEDIQKYIVVRLSAELEAPPD
jgi:REP element-mobilizing transposase RayT